MFKNALSFSPHGVVQEIFVGQADAILQLGTVGPTQLFCLAYIQKLTGSAVRFAGVPKDFAFIAHHFGYQFCQFLDAQFLACSSVYSFVSAVVVHQEDTQVCQVVHIEEFTQRRTVSPTGNRCRPTFLGFVKATDQGRKDMAMGIRCSDTYSTVYGQQLLVWYAQYSFLSCVVMHLQS